MLLRYSRMDAEQLLRYCSHDLEVKVPLGRSLENVRLQAFAYDSLTEPAKDSVRSNRLIMNNIDDPCEEEESN